MTIYVLDDGYGPGFAAMTGGLPPAVIFLLTGLLVWVVTRALSVGMGKPVPPGGAGWAAPTEPVVDPREVRRVRAEIDAEWTSYHMDPYSISSDRGWMTSASRRPHGFPLPGTGPAPAAAGQSPTASVDRRV